MRTTTTITLKPEYVNNYDSMLTNFMVKNGFNYVQYKGETVHKKGNGWVMAPRIYKFKVEGNKLHIESWLPFAILPGVYVGESGLDSWFGIAVKKVMRNFLLDIIYAFHKQDEQILGYMPY